MLSHTEPATLWLSAALSGSVLCDLESTRFAHSVALSHPQKHSASRHEPLMRLMGCYAPVSLCSPSVCSVAVGVNVHQCRSLTIVGVLLSLALCCSDLYFVFPRLFTSPSAGSALFFMFRSLSNELFHFAAQYGSSGSKQMGTYKAFIL